MTIYDFHPAADIFPLMEGEGFDALVADIKKHRGLRERIKLLGKEILDGRNRYRACLAAGVQPTFEHLSAVEPVDYVVGANLHRRHLTVEQKRDVIAKLLKAQPEKSDRQIGKMAQVSKNTAKSVRDEMEARGQIDHVETRTDTRGRKQPAKKSTKKAERKRKARGRETREYREAMAVRAEIAADFAAQKVEAEQLAIDLIKLDRNLAQRIYAHLAGGESWLKEALGRGLGLEGDALEDVKPEGNGADHPQASADQRKAEFAKLDDGIPDFLRRAPEAMP